MRIVYIYYGNHFLFDTWTRSIGAEARSFVPRWVFDFRRLKKNDGSFGCRVSNFFRKRPAALQLAAMINSLFIPQADVYVLENMACVSAVYLKNTKKRKVILFNGDQFFLDLPSANATRKKIAEKLTKKIDGIISISLLYKNLCKKYLPIPNKMVYPYADVETYSKENADLDSKNIAFLGYIVLLKGIDVLVEAFLEIPDNAKEKLYLIGSIVDNIPVLAQNKNNNKIITTGWSEHPQDYLKHCSVYANPARKEAFGINIIEAMCMGLVPIVSDNCGAAEIVKEVSPRLIIPVDKEELKRRIIWLNSNPQVKRELSEKCRRVGKTYTKEKSVKEFKEAFNSLLNEIQK